MQFQTRAAQVRKIMGKSHSWAYARKFSPKEFQNKPSSGERR